MAIPPQFKDLIEVDVNTLTYAPHVWFNDFWLLRDYLVGGWVGGWVGGLGKGGRVGRMPAGSSRKSDGRQQIGPRAS
jgi:hypothetical protein